MVAECGTDLQAWKSAKHFTSWLCLAPGNKISSGKLLSSRTRRSSSRTAALLRLAAVTIGRSDTALGAFYRRLSSRIGKQKAVTATARKIAVLFYNANLVPSMSRRGNCWDNAVVESFFNLLKRERIRRKKYKTREEARRDVFDYIEFFYNPQRKHVRNGMLSPIDFEQQQKLKLQGV